MSKLRNSRPDTLQRSSPSCRLPGCCSAAVMPWLPPACLVGVRVMQELVSIDWIKDSENPNIQTGRSKNCQFNSVDEVLAETALEAMENHYWYLCGSMVLFALFTSLVSEEEKQNMVQKLLSLEKPMSIKFGTPKFQVPREGRGGHSLILSLRRAAGCLTAARMILSSCPCLWRSGRLMTSSWRQRSSSRRWNVTTLEWTRALSTRDVIDYKYYLLKNVFMSRRTFNAY